MAQGTGRPPDKRSGILEAAVSLFAAQGFHGTAMPEIAQRADVGTGTIYRYFDTKEALVNAAYQAKQALILDALADALPAGQPRPAQFRALWDRLIGLIRAEPAAFRFLELHHRGDYLDATSRAAAADARAPITGFLAAAAAEGAVRDLPAELLWSLVWGALIGLARAADEGAITLDAGTAAAAGRAMWQAIALPPLRHRLNPFRWRS